MLNKKIFSALAIIAIGFTVATTSCYRRVVQYPDLTKPTIFIQHPALNDTTYLSTDSVHMEFLVQDDVQLSSVTVEVRDGGNTLLYSETNAANGAAFNYNKFFNPAPIGGVQVWSMTVNATDQNNNMATQSTTFFVAP